MKLSFVILSLVICAVLAQTPLPTGNAWVTSSAAPSATTPVFEVPNTGFNDFVIQVVRTNTQSYDKGVGDGDYNIKVMGGTFGTKTSHTGQIVVTTQSTATYSVSVTNEGTFTQNYKIRYCLGRSCPSTCYRSTISGFCTGQGACNTNTKSCSCDTIINTSTNKTEVLSSTCGVNLAAVVGLWESLFALWIVLIVVGVLLALLPPILCCLCCCGIICASNQPATHTVVVTGQPGYQRA